MSVSYAWIQNYPKYTISSTADTNSILDVSLNSKNSNVPCVESPSFSSDNIMKIGRRLQVLKGHLQL